MKRSRLEVRNGILMLVWTLEYLDRPWNHVEMKRCHLEQFSERFLCLHLRHNLTVTYPKRVDKECMRKHSGSDLSGPKLAELLDVLACETPGPGKSHTRECKAHQDAWEESRQTAAAGRRSAESLRIQIHDH